MDVKVDDRYFADDWAVVRRAGSTELGQGKGGRDRRVVDQAEADGAGVVGVVPESGARYGARGARVVARRSAKHEGVLVYTVHHPLHGLDRRACCHLRGLERAIRGALGNDAASALYLPSAREVFPVVHSHEITDGGRVGSPRHLDPLEDISLQKALKHLQPLRRFLMVTVPMKHAHFRNEDRRLLRHHHLSRLNLWTHRRCRGRPSYDTTQTAESRREVRRCRLSVRIRSRRQRIFALHREI
eukprot:scaffold878_cov271-Pinguiococcus_pyrenoidosus.AAC.27